MQTQISVILLPWGGGRFSYHYRVVPKTRCALDKTDTQIRDQTSTGLLYAKEDPTPRCTLPKKVVE